MWKSHLPMPRCKEPQMVSYRLGSVWNPKNTRERKKNIKENDFLMFGFIVENIKEIQIDCIYF